MDIKITRKELFSIVVITSSEGRTCTTTMDKNIKKDDEKIKNLIKSFNHLPLKEL